MKAVLVIDMPKDCGDCPCIHDELWKCQADKQFREGTYYNGRPSWCPLRPLPKKSEMTDDWRVADLIETESGRMARCYFKGRNEVIDEITGEKK